MNFIDTSLIVDSPRLRRARDQLITAHLSQLKAALSEVTREAEKALEEKTREVAPGRLWRAWTSTIAPGPGKNAYEPAGWIRLNSHYQKNGRISRTYGAIMALTTSGRITGKSEQWLAIPLPAAGPRGRDRWLTPGEWEQATGLKLRFVFRPGKPALLVTDQATTNKRTGTVRGITRKRTAADVKRGFVRGAQTVPIFVLVPFVAHEAKFSIEGVVAPFQRELVNRATSKIEAIGTFDGA